MAGVTARRVVLLSEGYRPEAVTAGPELADVEIPGTHLDIVNRPEGIAQTLSVILSFFVAFWRARGSAERHRFGARQASLPPAFRTRESTSSRRARPPSVPTRYPMMAATPSTTRTNANFFMPAPIR